MGFAEDLVAGPRSRRLCFNIGDREGVADWEVSALLAPLAESVDAAMYWQEPDEVDRTLAAPDIVQELLPIARAIAAAPGVQWWCDPIDLDRQFHVEFDHTGPPRVARTSEELADWRASAPFSAVWWSTPSRTVVHTTRALAGMGPLGLCLEEDGFGSKRAWCRSVRPARTPSVYEITGPTAWSELAERYPLEVSRHPHWRKVTGWEGRWVAPGLDGGCRRLRRRAPDRRWLREHSGPRTAGRRSLHDARGMGP
ncbi:hypothetical protein E1202_08435 [Saccharopolyspora karakumensis]|uniref:Uncharacterized protein n=1 Tax=Saccharopolyspora karakumensis TaxID=2530386 RepID=A0A4R5BYW4_9PSEU|nr:hypothetical protein [Saccharopolyspora karakumensis]TDD90640.1 hypothetical protein E1202_08435 [Saccharopolyspora karakumensis]